MGYGSFVDQTTSTDAHVTRNSYQDCEEDQTTPTEEAHVKRKSYQDCEDTQRLKQNTTTRNFAPLLCDKNDGRLETQLETQHRYPQKISTWARARLELSSQHSIFALYDYHYSYDDDIAIIDVQSSFAPTQPLFLPLLFRSSWLYLSLNMLHEDLKEEEGHLIRYYSHLTDLTMSLTTLYQLMSFFLTLLSALNSRLCCSYSELFAPTPVIPTAATIERGEDVTDTVDGSALKNNNAPSRPGKLVCITWILYSITLPSEFLVMAGYWSFICQEDENTLAFRNLYVHGGIAFLLLLDGNIVGRIPLRLRHIITVYVYGFLYIVWTLVYAYSNIEDGVIYPILNWRRHPEIAAMVSGIMMFVFGPVIFICCWLFTQWSECCSCNGRGRRVYLRGDNILESGGMS